MFNDYLFKNNRLNDISLSQRSKKYNITSSKNPTSMTEKEFLISTGNIKKRSTSIKRKRNNRYNNNNRKFKVLKKRANSNNLTQANSNNLTQAQPLSLTQPRPIRKGGKKSKQKIHKGPRGGKYYIKKGKKVYLRK